MNTTSTFTGLVIVFLFCLAACDTGGQSDQPGATEAESELEEGHQYEVFLQEGISDTLRGSASFGRVVDGGTGTTSFIIALEDAEDMTDGIFLVQDEKDLEEGLWPVLAEDEEGDGFYVHYRSGMLREFTGTSGDIELTTVTDTLIEGQFDIEMDGYYVLPGESEEQGSIRARGAFRAAHGDVGFVVGI